MDALGVQHRRPGVEDERRGQQAAQRTADEVAADRRRAPHGPRAHLGGGQAEDVGYPLVDPVQDHGAPHGLPSEYVGLRHLA